MEPKKHVCVDLDGVLAHYGKWEGVKSIGAPLPGALDFVKRLAQHFNVVIHTARTLTPEGYEATLSWLETHGFHSYVTLAHTTKPIAVAYIDDRAVNCQPQLSASAFDTAFEKAVAFGGH